MKISPINESLSCKARLDKKTLRMLSKEFENTKVENASFETLLTTLDRKGSRVTKLSIGNPIKTNKNTFYRKITITNPLFGNNECTTQTPARINESSLADTVQWICVTKAVDKMESSLFGKFLESMKLKNPNSSAVDILHELLPSFKVGGCSKSTMRNMINTAVESDRNALLSNVESLESKYDKTVISVVQQPEKKSYIGTLKEKIISKFS